MPEIQISGSEDDGPASAVRPEIDDSSGGSGGVGAGNTGFEGTGTGTCSHYCGGWQSSICASELSDEDLRKLVVELKRKVEFTERMNWLCEYTLRLLKILFVQVMIKLYLFRLKEVLDVHFIRFKILIRAN